jgi:hypothetical protein
VIAAGLRRGLAGLALTALLGCSIGGSVAGWKPATQAAGTAIELDLGGNHRVKGELIALDSAGFLVLEPTRLVRVDPAELRGGSGYKTNFDAPLSAQTRDRLRLMSRYPQGVSPEVEEALLQAYGWSRVEVETASTPP